METQVEAGAEIAKQVTETQPLTIQQLVKKMKLHMKMLQRTKQKVFKYTPVVTAVKLQSSSPPKFHKNLFQIRNNTPNYNTKEFQSLQFTLLSFLIDQNFHNPLDD